METQSPNTIFDRIRNELRAEIARIEDADLTAPCRAEMTIAEFLLMVIRHEAWHAGHRGHSTTVSQRPLADAVGHF